MLIIWPHDASLSVSSLLPATDQHWYTSATAHIHLVCHVIIFCLPQVDSTLASTLNAFVKLSLNLVGALFLILYATPGFILFIIPVGAMFLYVQEFYRKSSVDLRRLEALARSPLYSHFSEVCGIHYGKQKIVAPFEFAKYI